MKKKRILLTGDDGYNSIGTRLLITVLGGEYELTVAATKTQQSAIGGKITMNAKPEWCRTQVDGVSGFYVGGTPSDAIECARICYPDGFDLVISGINMGLNIGGTVVSSGTVSAALRAVSLKVAPVSLAMSWDVSPSMFFHDHNGADEISHAIGYPGKQAADIVRSGFANGFWGGNLINVNFPKSGTYSGVVRRTMLAHDAGYWPPVVVDQKGGTYEYPHGDHQVDFVQPDTDASAVCAGEISLSVCTWNLGSDRQPEMLGDIIKI